MSTDPTYKEWKRREFEVILIYLYKHGSYLQGMETFCGFSGSRELLFSQCTDPTYKEWKPVPPERTLKEHMHGSYLQGMET